MVRTSIKPEDKAQQDDAKLWIEFNRLNLETSDIIDKLITRLDKKCARLENEHLELPTQVYEQPSAQDNAMTRRTGRLLLETDKTLPKHTDKAEEDNAVSKEKNMYEPA